MIGTKPTAGLLSEEDLVRGAHLVITLGRGDACPSVPGLDREVWPFEDPQGKDVEQVRHVLAGE